MYPHTHTYPTSVIRDLVDSHLDCKRDISLVAWGFDTVVMRKRPFPHLSTVRSFCPYITAKLQELNPAKGKLKTCAKVSHIGKLGSERPRGCLLKKRNKT